MTQTTATIQELKELWEILFPEVTAPENAQWALWLLRHNPTVVRQGIVELATKYRKLQGQMDPLYMAKFSSSVMNRLTAQQTAAYQYGADAEGTTGRAQGTRKSVKQ